tara:strand:- start:9647 stop:10417 length:771 start_codon:yes stop_codon:yes gene_type:complete
VSKIKSIKLIDVSIPKTSINFIPNQKSIPKTRHITRDLDIPAISMPCVEIRRDGLTNKQLMKDDPKNNLTINCLIPSFQPMIYNTKKTQKTNKAAIPNTDNLTESRNKNKSKTETKSETKTETANILLIEEKPCPDPNKNNPRIGDFSNSGNEVVIGFKLIKETQECVILYRNNSIIEKYLPSLNLVSNTFAITTVAVTAGTIVAPFLTKIVKPLSKKIIKKIKSKLLNKKVEQLTKKQIITNKYREKKELPPFYK